jgi:hypothetical protein
LIHRRQKLINQTSIYLPIERPLYYILTRKQQSGSLSHWAWLHGNELWLWECCRQKGDDCSYTEGSRTQHHIFRHSLSLWSVHERGSQSTTRRNSKLILYFIIIMERETVVGSTIINLYHACFNIYAVHDGLNLPDLINTGFLCFFGRYSATTDLCPNNLSICS